MVFESLFGRQESKDNAEDIVKRLEEIRTERELALREAILERKNAYKLAEAQERFTWVAPTGVATAVMSGLAAFHHKNIMYCLPVIPITAYVGYLAHYTYGNKLDLILDTANKITLDPKATLSSRSISVREIDARVDISQKESAVLNCVDMSD